MEAEINFHTKMKVRQPICWTQVSKILTALLSFCFIPVYANPIGPQLVFGQANFSWQGKLLTITTSPNTILNWQSFSIQSGETTRFLQQDANSRVLNRIQGQDPSQILGRLESNGRVFLINPNGILFGSNAQVDVNGLVAATLPLSNSDFLANKLHFEGSQAGAILNQGTITTPNGGQVFLIASDVENSGIIHSPQGEIMLAAGYQVELVDSIDPAMRILISASNNQARNLGQLIAHAGKIGIYGALVKQSGIANADSVVRDQQGKIVFKASTDTRLEAGSLSSATGGGGEIQVLGQRVGLFGDAKLDVSGDTGGGTVLVGGSYQGQGQAGNPALQAARQTQQSSDSTILADARQTGDGGKIVLWSSQSTRATGTLSARGGTRGGNGGVIETSGHVLDVMGLRVNTRAEIGRPGRGGTWLLDPFDIEVSASGAVSLSDAALFDNLPTSGTSSIAAATIVRANSDVTLQAIHDIHFNSAIDITDPGIGLTAQAGNNINVNQRVGTNGGAIILSANEAVNGASGKGAVMVNQAISSKGGAVTVRGAAVKFSATGSIVAGAASVAVIADSGGGRIQMDDGASITVDESTKPRVIALQADNMQLSTSGGTSLAINGTGQINLAPFTVGRDIQITDAGKLGTTLELTSTELNNIRASDLVLVSEAKSALLTPTVLDQVTFFYLIGKEVALNDHLLMRQRDGRVLLRASEGSVAVGTAGAVTTRGDQSIVYLHADDLRLGGAKGAIDAGSGTVLILPYSATTEIQLGKDASSSRGILGLDETMLNQIATSGVLQVGLSDFGWAGHTALLPSGLDLGSAAQIGTLRLQSSTDLGNLTLAGPLKVCNSVELFANKLLTLSSGASVAAPNIMLAAKNMALNSAPGSIDGGAGLIWILPLTTTKLIDLGGSLDIADRLSLSNSEINTFKGTGVLRFGSLPSAYALHISAPIAPAFAGTVSFNIGGNVTQGPQAGISTDKLSINALGDVTLDANSNAVARLAVLLGDDQHRNLNFSFKNARNLHVETALDGASGVQIVDDGNAYNPANPNSVIALISSGALTQSDGATISSKALYVEAASVELASGNVSPVIAGKSTGSASGDGFHYVGLTEIFLRQVLGSAGITQPPRLTDPASGIQLEAGPGGIRQDEKAALITAAGLTLNTTGPIDLSTADNQAASLSVLGAASIQFRNFGVVSVDMLNQRVDSAIQSMLLLTDQQPFDPLQNNIAHLVNRRDEPKIEERLVSDVAPDSRLEPARLQEAKKAEQGKRGEPARKLSCK